jgi:hypothetical protein
MLGKKIARQLFRLSGVAGGDGLGLFHSAGTHAENGICRAKTDEACHQRQHAYPAPYTDSSSGRKSDQNQTSYDTQCTINRMFVNFHFDLLG